MMKDTRIIISYFEQKGKTLRENNKSRMGGNSGGVYHSILYPWVLSGAVFQSNYALCFCCSGDGDGFGFRCTGICDRSRGTCRVTRPCGDGSVFSGIGHIGAGAAGAACKWAVGVRAGKHQYGDFGGARCKEQIKNVSGIGDKKYSDIESLIEVGNE